MNNNIINSIKQDVNNANYIEWDKIKNDNYQRLIKLIIENDYVLSNESCDTLKNDYNIVLNSIKKDINTIEYATYNMRFQKDIFKYLLLNNYHFSDDELKNISIINCLDKEIMTELLKKLNLISDNEDFYNMFNDHELKLNVKKYVERYNILINKSLNTYPKISNFKELLDYFSELEWEEY